MQSKTVNCKILQTKKNKHKIKTKIKTNVKHSRNFPIQHNHKTTYTAYIANNKTAKFSQIIKKQTQELPNKQKKKTKLIKPKYLLRVNAIPLKNKKNKTKNQKPKTKKAKFNKKHIWTEYNQPENKIFVHFNKIRFYHDKEFKTFLLFAHAFMYFILLF